MCVGHKEEQGIFDSGMVLIGRVDFGFGSHTYLSLDGMLFQHPPPPNGKAGSGFVGTLASARKVSVLPGKSVCRSVRFLPLSIECQKPPPGQRRQTRA